MKIRNKDLEVKRLEHYQVPPYPTLAVHNSDPALVLRHIPAGWAGKGLTLTVLATFALSTPPGFAAHDSSVQGALPNPRNGQASNLPDSGKVTAEQASIAPVFIHGDGRGATGCVVIGAPVFLTENEAMEIVLAELQRAGLSFDDRNRLLPGMEWDQPLVSEGFFPGEAPPAPSAKKPFTVELYDTRTRLAVKLITSNNYRLSGGGLSRSTVVTYDLLALAQKTVERLQASGKVNAVVFYDPLEYGGMSPQDREKGIARAREQLRAQVHDFLRWLKAHGPVGQPKD